MNSKKHWSNSRVMIDTLDKKRAAITELFIKAWYYDLVGVDYSKGLIQAALMHVGLAYVAPKQLK